MASTIELVANGPDSGRQILSFMFHFDVAQHRRTTIMSTAHVSSLAAKHADIEARLHAELVRPQPDSALVAILKKQKLRLKEAMLGR